MTMTDVQRENRERAFYRLYAALTGDSLENRAASLVKVALQRDMVSRLVELCRKRRPNGGF